MPTAISQINVGDMAKGKDGRLYGDHPNAVEENEPTGDNAAAQVTEIVVGSATDGAVYSYEVEGYEVSLTYNDATPTVAEVADQLAAAHDAAGIFPGSIMSASSDGVDTVTLTAERDGEAIEVRVTAGDLAATTTTEASNGDVLPFGRVYVRDATSGKMRLPEAGDAATDFVGYGRYTDDEASQTIGDSGDVGYPPGRDAIVVKRGRVYVAGNQASAATRASDVWVGTDAGEAGKLFTADNAGTTRIQATSGFAWKEANVLEVFTSNL